MASSIEIEAKPGDEVRFAISSKEVNVWINGNLAGKWRYGEVQAAHNPHVPMLVAVSRLGECILGGRVPEPSPAWKREQLVKSIEGSPWFIVYPFTGGSAWVQRHCIQHERAATEVDLKRAEGRSPGNVVWKVVRALMQVGNGRS